MFANRVARGDAHRRAFRRRGAGRGPAIAGEPGAGRSTGCRAVSSARCRAAGAGHSSGQAVMDAGDAGHRGRRDPRAGRRAADPHCRRQTAGGGIAPAQELPYRGLPGRAARRALVRVDDKGTVFVSTRVLDRVYAIVNRNGKREVKVLVKGLHSPNGIALHAGTLFIAEINKISMIKDVEDHLDDAKPP